MAIRSRAGSSMTCTRPTAPLMMPSRSNRRRTRIAVSTVVPESTGALLCRNIRQCAMRLDMSNTRACCLRNRLQCSNLIYGKLGFVHQAISGEKDMSWHFPEYDCLDTAEILRWFIDNTGSW